MTIVLSTALPTTSLSTYDKLKTAVASWLHRSDMTDIIPDLVALAEARIARDLRIQSMVTTDTLTSTADLQTVNLPDDFLELKNISLNTSTDRELTLAGIQELNTRFPVGAYTGAPYSYAIEGTQIYLGPVPDQAYDFDIIYYARFQPLSQSPSNWLLTNHPGIYLFGTLAESGDFVRDAESLGKWESKYKQQVFELQRADKKSAFSGSQIRMRAI